MKNLKQLIHLSSNINVVYNIWKAYAWFIYILKFKSMQLIVVFHSSLTFSSDSLGAGHTLTRYCHRNICVPVVLGVRLRQCQRWIVGTFANSRKCTVHCVRISSLNPSFSFPQPPVTDLPSKVLFLMKEFKNFVSNGVWGILPY